MSPCSTSTSTSSPAHRIYAEEFYRLLDGTTIAPTAASQDKLPFERLNQKTRAQT